MRIKTEKQNNDTQIFILDPPIVNTFPNDTLDIIDIAMDYSDDFITIVRHTVIGN